jgi:cytochrome P450
VLQERIEEPRDDLISKIVHAEMDGRPVTADEAYGVASLLYPAGLDTVTSALSFFMRYLARHPDDQRRLVEDGDVLPKAVEELLRRHAFVNNSRRVMKEIDFAGVHMMPGDRVIVSHVIASRDPEEYPDPDHVDFDRSMQGHFAFGAGPHRCLGSHLARLELRIALEEWHRRIPSYELSPGKPIGAHGGSVMGVYELHLQWQPERRHL